MIFGLDICRVICNIVADIAMFIYLIACLIGENYLMCAICAGIVILMYAIKLGIEFIMGQKIWLSIILIVIWVFNLFVCVKRI